MITFVIVLGIVIIVFAASRLVQNGGTGKNTSVQEISPAEARKMMVSNEKAVLLDVRTPEEYRGRHIPNSRSLPLDRIENEAEKQLPDKTVPIITYCQTGRRSAMAAAALSRLGYENVYNLGGILNWPYETESGNGKDR